MSDMLQLILSRRLDPEARDTAVQVLALLAKLRTWQRAVACLGFALLLWSVQDEMLAQLAEEHEPKEQTH